VTASLVIAATTEVLRHIVDTAVQRAFNKLGGGISKPAITTGVPPSSAASDVSDPPTVNLFLYRATPNVMFRNLPVRDTPGAPTALDLDYLVSPHGPAVESEIGFAAALNALHQTAVVPPPVIREALQRLVSHTNPVLRAIGTDDQLIDTLESIQISSSSLDLDTITRLWISAQAPLRPSACYRVTLVFRDLISAQD
jgi:hypothetical protein